MYFLKSFNRVSTRQGFIIFTSRRNDPTNEDNSEELLKSLLPIDGSSLVRYSNGYYPFVKQGYDVELDGLLSDYYPPEKRNVASLARDYSLPSGKRNVAALARDSVLPSGKRSNENVAAYYKSHGPPNAGYMQAYQTLPE